MIPKPRLLSFSEQLQKWETQRIIEPSRVSINLAITPLSDATMVLPYNESLPVRGYVELFTCMGSAGIFRVRSPQDVYGKVSTTAELEHAIVEVGDYLVKTKISEMKPASEAFRTIFGYYNGGKWQIGDISDLGNTSIAVEVDYDRVLDALLAILENKPDCMMTFNFNTVPWTLNVVKRGISVQAEGRLSRNVSSATVTYDDTELATKVYYQYETNGTMGWHTKEANIAQYGLVERSISVGSGYTQDEADLIAETYLAKHKAPRISIEIDALEFSHITGESFDSFDIGKLYRLALPDYGETIEKNVTGLSFEDVYGQPERIIVRLAEEEDATIKFLHELDAGGGTTSGGLAKRKTGGLGNVKDTLEDIITDVDLFSAKANNSENILSQAGLYIDGENVLQYADDYENKLGARLRILTDEASLMVGTLNIPDNAIVRCEKYPDNFPEVGDENKYYLETSTGIMRVYEDGAWVRIPVSKDNKHKYFIKAGDIAIAINKDGSTEAHIDANKVILGQADLTAEDLATWAKTGATKNGVFAKFLTVKALTAEEIETVLANIGEAHISGLYVDNSEQGADDAFIAGGLNIDHITFENEEDPVIIHTDSGGYGYYGPHGVYVNGTQQTAGSGQALHNIMILSTDDINFSKATLLTGAWGSQQVSAGKILTVSGSPAQTPELSYTVGFGGSPQLLLQLDGNGNASAVTSDYTHADRKKITLPVKVFWTDSDTETSHNVFTTTLNSNGMNNYITATGVYDNGWKAAWSDFSSKILDSQKDPETDQLVENQVWIKYPNSAVDGNPIYRRYTVDADAEKAYIKLGNTKVAEMTHNQYALGQASVKVAYNNAKVIQQGQQQDTIQAIEPATSGGSGYLQLELDIGTAPTATSPSRTVGVKVGGSLKTELSETLNDYGNGYSAGNAHRASQISGYAIVPSGTVTATLQAEKKYLFQTQYQKADGTWGNGASYIFETPAGGSVTWPSAISQVTAATQSATFTANGTSKTYGMYVGDFPNAGGTIVNAVQLISSDNDVVAAIDINGLLVAQYQAGENHIKDAGGTEDIYSNGEYSLDKYVTTLTVDVPTTSQTSRGKFSCDVYSSYGSYTVTLTRTYSSSSSSDLAFFRGKDGSTVTVYT